MNIMMRRMFGPIRHCVQLDSTTFVCAVATPGFTGDTLQGMVSESGVVVLEGDTSLTENGVLVRRCQVHEAIHLPHRVIPESVKWETRNGLTILRCQTHPPNSNGMFSPTSFRKM